MLQGILPLLNAHSAGIVLAYFIADIRSYSQLKIEHVYYFLNPQEKIPN
jgi:hypothetical protein